MKLTDFVIKKIAGKYIGKQIESQLKEARGKSKREEREEALGWWRQVGGPASAKDIEPISHQKMQEIAFRLYDRDPLAKRAIEMKKDFIIGEGISFNAEDIGVQEVLDKFWKDPVNAWELKQSQKALEIGLYGEQCYPTFVNKENGHVRLGYLDPTTIHLVEADPDNIEKIIKVIRKVNTGEEIDKTKFKSEFTVVNLDEDPDSKTVGRLQGECFYFAVNKVANSLRGRSDLLPVIDWIDAYERFLFNRAERAHLLNNFIWDVELKGLNATEIKEWLKDQTIPLPGTIRAHNEKAIWKAVVPKLEAQDASNEARLLLNHILAGLGYPPHWFAWGEGLTRATALEMGTPVFKMLQSRQKYFKYMITFIFEYVIDQAIIHDTLKDGVNRKFTVNFPKLTSKDFVDVASALNSTTASMQIAQEKQWITEETARNIYAFMISQIGIDVDPMNEDQVQEEIAKIVERLYESQPKLAKALNKIKNKWLSHQNSEKDSKNQ